MRRLLFLLVAVVFLFNYSIGEAQSKKSKAKSQDSKLSGEANDKGRAPFTIRGEIANMAQIKSDFGSDSFLFLQLMIPPSNGEMSAKFSNGRLYIATDGPRIPFPQADGKFSFEIEKLNPGVYSVIATGYGFTVDILGDSLFLLPAIEGKKLKIYDDRIKIEIPSDVKLPFLLDLGKVSLPALVIKMGGFPKEK